MSAFHPLRTLSRELQYANANGASLRETCDQRAHELNAESDQAAIKIANARREARRMELWQRDRQIKVWVSPLASPSPTAFRRKASD